MSMLWCVDINNSEDYGAQTVNTIISNNLTPDGFNIIGKSDSLDIYFTKILLFLV